MLAIWNELCGPLHLLRPNIRCGIEISKNNLHATFLKLTMHDSIIAFVVCPPMNSNAITKLEVRSAAVCGVPLTMWTKSMANRAKQLRNRFVGMKMLKWAHK